MWYFAFAILCFYKTSNHHLMKKKALIIVLAIVVIGSVISFPAMSKNRDNHKVVSPMYTSSGDHCALVSLRHCWIVGQVYTRGYLLKDEPSKPTE